MANNLISLSTQPLQIESPIDQYAKVSQIAGLQQRRQLQAQQMEHSRLQIEEQKRGMAEQEALSEIAHRKANDIPGMLDEASRHPLIRPQTVARVRDEFNKAAEAQAKRTAEEAKNTEGMNADVVDALLATKRLPPEQQQANYEARQRDIATKWKIPPKQLIPFDPTDAQFLDSQLARTQTESGIMKLAGEKRAQDTADAAAKKAAHDQTMFPIQEATATTEGEQKARELAGTSATGIKAVEQARLDFEQKRFDKEVDALHETIRSHKATEAETRRFHDLSLDGVKLTPEATDKMAEMFATTGQLPAMGNGKEASRNRSTIMNRAAEIYPTVQFATQKAAFQANEAALKNLQKQSDSVEAFEKTAGKNIDVFLAKAKNVVDTGSPLLNSPVRMISDTVFGSENMAAFKAARETALTEAAKVLESPQGSASLTVDGRKAVKVLSDENATLGMQIASMGVLKQDMENRKQSNRDQIEAIKKRISAPERADKPAEEAGKVKVWNPKTNKFE